MKERLLIIRTDKLTVKNLDELKASDNVGEIRSVLGFLILVVNEKFETQLEFIDVQQIFDVVVDGRLTLSEVDPEMAEKFRQEMGAYLRTDNPFKGSVVNFVRSPSAPTEE